MPTARTATTTHRTRQDIVLALLLGNGPTKLTDIKDALGVSINTARQFMVVMIESRLVEHNGKISGRRYSLTTDGRALLKTRNLVPRHVRKRPGPKPAPAPKPAPVPPPAPVEPPVPEGGPPPVREAITPNDAIKHMASELLKVQLAHLEAKRDDHLLQVRALEHAIESLHGLVSA